MADLRVTGIRLASSPRDAELGIVARFDCLLGPVVLTGCYLKRRPTGRAVAIMPRLKDGGASLRMVRDEDHAELCRLAGAAYSAISGAVAADDAS